MKKQLLIWRWKKKLSLKTVQRKPEFGLYHWQSQQSVSEIEGSQVQDQPDLHSETHDQSTNQPASQPAANQNSSKDSKRITKKFILWWELKMKLVPGIFHCGNVSELAHTQLAF